MGIIESWESQGNVHVDLRALRAEARHTVLAEIAVKYGGEGPYLDVGCGNGFISELIRQIKPDADIAIADAYQECLIQTTAKIKPVLASYLLDEHEFSPDNIIPLKFKVVILSHVLEHLRDPIGGIECLLNLLNPTGVLILAVPNTARPEVTINALFQRHYVNRGHVFSWDASHWRNFLERICRVEVIEYAADIVSLVPGRKGHWIGRRFGRQLARLFPWWSFSNIAVIRRVAC